MAAERTKIHAANNTVRIRVIALIQSLSVSDPSAANVSKREVLSISIY